ncbi:TetR/AcrR family transcriptional regulator [Thermomonospora umbrina]|uniref:TetR family transcriptional regulator n=1 Tax=Thermomonospora umbrina TaxID=111806 RepID=A0A3D9SSK6_9ACTN|nr:TetR/AcrR family transcriptional regulator [Thermomonospora umbrina]REE97460.1 TetR family transcriptional regulator [Thermomonospora umbrina]
MTTASPASGYVPQEGTRSARSRKAIVEAATETFLRKGYPGTSMDEIAGSASVSKQTVYKHFADKETLFTHVITAMLAETDQQNQAAVQTLGDTDDPARGLQELARRFLASIRAPRVLQLRRLVIAEAERFPELGRAYWESGFERGITTLAEGFRRLTERGLLTTADPVVAAHHFAGLVLWIPMNRAMFCGDQDAITASELDHLAESAAAAFLAAYTDR